MIAPLALWLPVKLGLPADRRIRHTGEHCPGCVGGGVCYRHASRIRSHWVSSSPFMSVSMSGHDTLPFDVEQRCTSVANAASSMDKSCMR